MDQSLALAALSALSNETRLRLARMLIAAAPDRLAAADIAAQLGISASALSFHLATLEQAGLITSRRVSRQIFYGANLASFGALIGYLLNDCCSAHPDISACCAPKVSCRPEP